MGVERDGGTRTSDAPGEVGATRLSRIGCIDWAVAGRPLPGEELSGDLAACIPAGDGALLVAIDGLGHGAPAAQAAATARDTIAANGSESLATLLRLSHVALVRTRGAAITLARVQCGAGRLQWAGVGNVECYLVRRVDGQAAVAATAVLFGGTVGYRLPPVRESVVELRPGDLVIMATDGLEPGFVGGVATGQPVDRIAGAIVEDYARATDDALVAVARVRE
jgi:negative regulator of sigma-B (phosphoserine phosphatase)